MPDLRNSHGFHQNRCWLRDQLLCCRCKSIPRWRALIYVLETRFPTWREQRIHESSPGGPASTKLAWECHHYTPTHFFPDVPLEASRTGFVAKTWKNRNLRMPPSTWSLLPRTCSSMSYTPRAASPKSPVLFVQAELTSSTVPWYWCKETLVRATRGEDGKIRHLEPADYHGNPIDEKQLGLGSPQYQCAGLGSTKV